MLASERGTNELVVQDHTLTAQLLRSLTFTI